MSLFGLAMRGLLLRGRTVGLAVLPLLVGITAVLVRAMAKPADHPDAYGALTAELSISLGVALVGLVQGVSAFSDEREGGTLALLLATTAPRWRIVGAKLAAAWLSTWLITLPAVIGCVVLGVSGLPAGRVVGGALVASLLASGGYVGLFVLLSLLSRRGLLIGLAYVVVWEGSLATYTTALRNLSVGAYGRRLVAAPFAAGSIPFKVADVGLVGAVVVLVLLVAVTAALSAWRLPRIDVP